MKLISSTLIACFVLVGVAGASAEPLRRGAELAVKGTNGYWFGLERSDGYVALGAVKGEFRRPGTLKETQGVAYFGKVATPSPNGVEAHLGRLGDISLHFKPTGPLRRLPGTPSRCYEAQRPGVFVGSLHFRGELDYTRIDAHRVSGRLKLERGDCDRFDRFSRPSLGGGRGSLPGWAHAANLPTEVGLEARSSDRQMGVTFECSEGPGSDLAPENAGKPGRRYFEATTFEKYKGILIIRSAEVASDQPESFVFDDALTTASATPPPPFEGTASLSRATRKKPGPWVGTLAVDLPGAPDTLLAGPSFEANMNYYGYSP
jgi:hypothetical protein